ncbi:MAG: Crp/Fnr family transcriptional regulator [Lunatimonas sp.]|uniref:Crp/Fnr family transcriptional regulator n=1 Tax=Lunatimonas sp. TaxID=2060141 RepID=UPI00263B89D1|nr:Crp/Fnr family transcriptional regulator [Lunatimonas sp.]MCC5938675.1 Crp/Fnr family transcriptional regulator [Lunatimonas sp.]
MESLAYYIQEYFGVLKQEELKAVCNKFAAERLLKGEFLMKQGQPAHQLAFIKAGIIRIYAQDDGKEITQWISTPGYFLTEISSFMFGGTSRWSMQALSDVELYSISRSDYQHIVNLVPRWHELEKLFIIKCFAILENRVYNHLSKSAEERYQDFFKQHPALFNQVPLQYIASMLGMTPETLSRIRNKQLPKVLD